MAIRQKNKGSWQVRIYRGLDGTGKRLYDTYTVKGTKKDAEKFEREKMYSIDKGTYVAPTRVTFAEHAEYWIEHYVTQLRPTTRESYKTLLRRHAIPAIGNIQLEKLTPKDLQTLYTSRLKSGLSPRRVQYLHTVISGCLKYGVKMELLTRNAAQVVKAPRPRRKEVISLTPEHVFTLLQALESHFLEIVVVLAIGTGLRRGEILALRWSDVDLEAGTLTVRRTITELEKLSFDDPKTASGRRTVALPSFVISRLRGHREAQTAERRRNGATVFQQDLICAHDDGSPYRPSTITNSFSNVIRKTGLPSVSFHGLRHTHASLLLAQGVHPKVVQERLGHSTISITMDIYSHVMPTLQREAASKLDGSLGALGENTDK